MNKQYLTLISRIQDEVGEIGRSVDRVHHAWKRAHEADDDLYLDSVALNLHGFYSAVEKVFQLVAASIDQTKPEGENWHQALLHQMSLNIDTVRPPVISRELRNSLDDYRGFRHIVRNVYAFNLSGTRMANLVENLPHTYQQLKKEIGEFLSFLQTRARE